MWNKATGAPHVSRAEARDHQGLPPRPESEGLDDILVPTNLTDTSTAKQLNAVDLENAKNPPPPPVAPPGAAAPDATQPQPQPPNRSAHERAGNRELTRMRHDRKLRAQEAKVTSFAKRHFAGQQRRLVANAREQMGRLRLSRAFDLDELLRQLHDPDSIAKAKRLIRGIVNDAGDDALAELGLDLAYSIQSTVAREFVNRKGMKLIQDIDRTTRDALREGVGDVLAKGGALNDIVAAIDAVMGERIDRATRIGRTETAAAFNFGTEDGYRQSKQVELKEWLTAGDEHVRDTHRELDGAQVPLDDVFVSSSGARLGFPGDPAAGDPSETINCRCTLIPVVGSTAQAAPLPEAIRARMNGHAKPLTLEEFVNGE
jgi:SPP1 gp7 family putative phage head morphogenesis protein